MQTQPVDYLNIKTLKQSYGIKVKHNGKWVYAGDNDGLYLFDTEEERGAKREELSRQQVPIG